MWPDLWGLVDSCLVVAYCLALPTMNVIDGT